MNLLEERRDVYSQNGEDGVIEAIFAVIGEGSAWCCEFGAWDGIHFSNTRALVEQGWFALLIEADEERFGELVANTRDNPRVHAFNRLVDAATLDALLAEVGAPQLDLLVVDIDGLDYDVLAEVSIRPRVVCVEVNAGHHPDSRELLAREVAAANVGQPLGAFHDLMVPRGYQLAAYSGNAFYVLADDRLPALTPAEAYDQFLDSLSEDERKWLFHVGRGDVEPFHAYGNPLLTRERLGLGRGYVGVSLRARRLAHLASRRG